MSQPDDAQMLAAGLLSVCKQLLGRVRVLEEIVRNHPDLADKYDSQLRFRAAYEEDEFGRVTEELRAVLAALEDVDEAEEEATLEG